MAEERSIDKIIRYRRSTFINGLLPGGKIDDSIVEQLLENAVWAPSHGLVQAWNFKVFAGKGVERFFRVQQEIYRAVTPPGRFNQAKFDGYADKHERVSHVVIVTARRDPMKRFPKQEDIVSVACTVQNIYLSLDEYGVAGYLSTGDLCYSQPMREFLGLGDDDECIGFFILGVADPEARRPERKRTPAREKTEWFHE